MHIYSLLTIFFLSLLVACQNKELSPEDITVITGHIENPVSDRVILSHDNKFESSTSLENGLFYMEIPAVKPGYYYLNHGDEHIPIFVASNFHINLSLDTHQGIRSLRFQGRGRESNEYLSAYQNFRILNEPDWDDIWMVNRKKFSEQVNRYRIKNEAFLDNYLAKHANLDPKFIEKERARILYQWVDNLLLYGKKSHGTVGNESFLGPEIFDFMQGISMEEKDLLLLPEYKLFLTLILERYAEEKLELEPHRTLTDISLQIVDQNIYDEEIRNYLSYVTIKNYLSQGPEEPIDELHGKFRNICKDGKMLADVRQAMDQLTLLRDGLETAHFKALDITGTLVSSEEFLGKVVYLDLWATWCRPCRQQLSHLDSLRQSYKKEDIVFVSISLDEDQNAWKSLIGNGTLGGVQLIVGDGWDNSLRHRYMVEELPRYILIDRTGVIVNANAPPPSSKEVLKQITSLLQTS